MKKLFLLLALVLVSCSTEDEPENTETLSGTYFIESIENGHLNECEQDQNVTFNGTKITLNLFFIYEGACQNGDMNFNYKLVGDKIEIENIAGRINTFEGKVINDNEIEITHYSNGSINYVATYVKS